MFSLRDFEISQYTFFYKNNLYTKHHSEMGAQVRAYTIVS